MALFKSEEEKLKKEEERLREEEEWILKKKKFYGKVGHIHQGLSAFGLWGTLSDGKTKYKRTTIELHDDKLFIERNKTIINYTDIKEIFYENKSEAVIILYSGDGIPIQGTNSGSVGRRELKAFVNILNKIICDNEPQNAIQSNENYEGKTQDDMDRLIKLGEMYEKGLLTDEEFASMKKKIIEN